jgi:pimeloyl-ACP methyl ester carboxylesterase
MKTKILISLLVLILLTACGHRMEPQNEPLQNDMEIQENNLEEKPGYVPVFETNVCPFTLPQGKIEGQDVECGTLIVPEDRDNPEVGVVKQAVAIFRNTAIEEHQPDPIVFVEGGPGVEVLSKLYLVFDQFAPLLGDRDLIFYDPRGVGFSTPSLDCPESLEAINTALEKDLPPEEAQQLGKEALLTCGSRLIAEGVNLSVYNVVENAADLTDLRIALGYEQWNLLAVSYGTRVVQEMLRSTPQGIRSIVLDSAVSLEADFFEEVPGNVDHALERLFTSCAMDSDCVEAYPALDDQLYTLVKDMNDLPIRGPVANLISGERFEAVQADGSSLLNVVFNSLYSADVIPFLPKLISDTARGDYALLSALRSNMLTNRLFISEGAYHASVCFEEIPFNSSDEIEQNIAQYPHLAEFMTGPSGKIPFNQLCEDWRIPAASEPVNQPVSTDLPVLILAGEYDPVSPADWGEQIAFNMSQATFLEFQNIGHSVVLSHSCPLSIALMFINDPVQPLNTACMREIGLEFVTPVGLAEIALVPVEVAELGVQALVPEEWIAVKPEYYVSPDQSYELVVSKEMETPLEAFLAAWGAEEPGSEFSINAIDWTIYVAHHSDVGKIVFLAVSTADDGFYFTLLAGPSDQAETMQNNLFLPILQSFTVSE